MCMGFLSFYLLVKPNPQMRWGCALVLACYLLLVVESLPLGCLAAGTPTISKLPVVGLQHRDFDEELAPNLSAEERLESAVRRSHGRKARIEGMLVSKVGKETGQVEHKVSRESGREAGAAKLGRQFRSEGRSGTGDEGRGRRDDGYSAEVEAGDGAFLTSIYIGTPPTRVRAILDTGSDLVWQQCRPCISCFRQPDMPIFDPAHSSSFKRIACGHRLCRQLLRSTPDPSSSACALDFFNATCQFTYVYGDTSYTSGELAFDTLTLLDPHGQTCLQVEKFAFGCGYENRGASFVGADGVLGMGQGPLSLASQLSTPSFSYCLTSLQVSQLSPLLLGDQATNFLRSDRGSQVQVTSILTNKFMPTFYYLNLTGISVNKIRLDIPTRVFALEANGRGGLIVDSGTTITYLQERGYRIVLQAIQSILENQLQIPRPMFGLDLCFLSFNESLLPTLTFHFVGADMEIPGSSLFAHVGGIYCLALGASNDVSILGNIQQQNYQMLYDRNKRKLLFMQASCDQILT